MSPSIDAIQTYYQVNNHTCSIRYSIQLHLLYVLECVGFNIPSRMPTS